MPRSPGLNDLLGVTKAIIQGDGTFTTRCKELDSYVSGKPHGNALLMPQTGDCRIILKHRWNATASGPFFELNKPLPDILQGLPTDYLSTIGEFGGHEGFLGDEYLRLYRLDELIALNLAYDVSSLMPELIIFGSNGCGEAFAFRLREPAVVQIPFVPLVAEYAENKAASFVEFVRSLAASGHSQECNPEAVGMEVHEKHPICLGGNPTDPESKVLVPAAKHAEICKYWNKVYRHIAAQQGQ